MTTAAKTTKQIIQAYKVLRLAEKQTQAKLDALLETNALYRIFEPDTRHPHYTLASAGQRTVDAFEILVAGVLNWTIGSGTIAEELDNVKARQIVSDEDADDDLDALRLIEPVSMTEAEAADHLLSLLSSASSVLRWSETGMINFELEKLHGKKIVGRNKESPELKITPECRAAVTGVKKLGKELRDCGNGISTVRQELERKQVMRGLTGQRKDAAIDLLLKP